MGTLIWIIISGAVEFAFDMLKRHWKKPHKIATRAAMELEIDNLELKIRDLKKKLKEKNNV